MLFLPQHVLTRSGFFTHFPYFFPAFAKIFRKNLGYLYFLHRKIGGHDGANSSFSPLKTVGNCQNTGGALFFFGLFIVKFTLSSQ